MDPNLFHLDWDRVVEALATIVVLSFLLERALSVVFEHRYYIRTADERGLKEFIAFGLALFVCWHWEFDAVGIILLHDHTTFVGELVTAGVIAGGSKGSVKLFRDLMNWRSVEYDKRYPKPKNGANKAEPTDDSASSSAKAAKTKDGRVER